MKVRVTVADEDGIVLATILGASTDEPECPEPCDHDSHFSIDYVREDHGWARGTLAEDIVRYIPEGN